ncbi:ethyl tert-butyl ether degradation [Colletotrichum sojae]|uniref:Ethyl tert-butyl ether degradation n=1 Tax=Colletotrichum sojae TaxID=2175907 RepID=A0A8H6MU76_9PEZI|nr:ethyl tert-butyl ether degradation [Colletotrichum sojae]
MSITTTVLFRNEPDAKYDIDYYVKNHMPLVQSLWGKYGVTGWSVTRYTSGADGSAPEFSFGSIVTWESKDQIAAAFARPEAGQIMGDRLNFSNKKPIFLFGETIRRGGK